MCWSADPSLGSESSGSFFTDSEGSSEDSVGSVWSVSSADFVSLLVEKSSLVSAVDSGFSTDGFSPDPSPKHRKPWLNL